MIEDITEYISITVDNIDKINHLNTLKEKEIERLAKYGEYVKVVVLLRR